MGYASGNITLDALVDHIADQLIATGSWTSQDAGLPAGQTPAKRVVKHTDADSPYLFLERAVSTNGGNVRWHELLCRISLGYDGTTDSPTGTTYPCGAPVEGWQSQNSGVALYRADTAPNAGNNKSLTHYTWVEANGFISIIKADAGSFRDFTSIICVERVATPEYTDGTAGATKFVAFAYCTSSTNVYNGSSQYYYYNRESGTGLNRSQFFRPFTASQTTWESYLINFSTAFKSPVTGKVYYEFPYYSFNGDTVAPQPWGASAMWFFAGSQLAGLADGETFTHNSKTWIIKNIPHADDESKNAVSIAIRKA